MPGGGPEVAAGGFIPGVSPIAMCQLHREILVDATSRQRVARDDGRPGLLREIHEFWPPDLLELFRKAGLPRQSPPDPETGTDTLSGLDPGEAPHILSPLSGRTYQIDGSEIPLKARAAPGVQKIYWFCGEAFLGTVAPREILSWKPAPGIHKLRVLDDHGRSEEIVASVANP